MDDNETMGDWFPNFMDNLVEREVIKDPAILNQVSQDQNAESIIDEVLEHMPGDRKPQSPARLSRILDQMGKSHLYDNVYDILTREHNMRFRKLHRERGRGRRGR